MSATATTPNDRRQVDARCKEYQTRFPEWSLVRDAVDGERAVKAKKEAYLPRPNPEDDTTEAKKRYDQYRDRAVFYNATGRTLEGLVGQVFNKPCVAELTPRLKLIEDNVDGTGQTITQLAKLLLARVLSYGRAGLLADYPVRAADMPPATVADLDNGSIRPKVIAYSPFRIINWRTTEIGAQAVLSLVVLEEEYDEKDDGFATETGLQYRVLRLDVSNPAAPFYTVEIWRKTTGGDAYAIVEGYPVTPRQANSQPFDRIPFTFIGWQDNTPSCDSVPLLDLAQLNVHHYRVSADYYEAVFLCGQPTPVFAGLTKDWVKEVFPKGKIALGTRAAVPLPQGGTAMLLQAKENTMAKEAMTGLAEQMVALGAQLVTERQVQRTATETNKDMTISISTLSSSADNVSAALSEALANAGKFVGEDAGEDKSKISVKLNTDFQVSKMTAEERRQLLAEWQANGITTEEYRDVMTANGIATKTLEDYKSEIETDMQTMPQPAAVPGQQPGAGSQQQPPSK